MRSGFTRILLPLAVLLAAALLVASPAQSVTLPKTQAATLVANGAIGSQACDPDAYETDDTRLQASTLPGNGLWASHTFHVPRILM